MTPEERKNLVSIFVKMSYEDLREVNQIVVGIINNRRIKTAHTFESGDRVTWVGKHGRQSGVVQYVMTKNVKVKADTGVIWHVSGTLLKKA